MICVDASLAAKWLFPEEHSDLALDLAAACAQAGQRLVAPTLLPIEVTNILRQRMRREGLSLSEATRLLEQFFAFPIGIVSPSELHERALALAEAHKLPAVYDAHYVALAELLNCELWTSDQRLVRDLAGKLPFVRWIGDYAGSEA
ncbi:MAG: type II toxin-antitoxin system VapC family toxin [Coriobacteriia bacterium]